MGRPKRLSMSLRLFVFKRGKMKVNKNVVTAIQQMAEELKKENGIGGLHKR